MKKDINEYIEELKLIIKLYIGFQKDLGTSDKTLLWMLIGILKQYIKEWEVDLNEKE